MKILWIVNTIFPEVSIEIGLKAPNVGGWMYALAADIKGSDGNELAIASVYSGSELKKINIGGNRYYLIPSNGKDTTKYNSDMEGSWKVVVDDFKPDLVHIHGTEYPHSLAFLNGVNNEKNVVASIQGLVSVYERYYYAGIDFSDIVKNITFKDVIKLNSLIGQRRKFKDRGIFERKILASVPNVIGRTQWDYVHAKSVNNNIKYFFCNESLRTPFYNSNWDIKNIDRHSIFLSQAGYPIKGLHIVLKACNILKNKYDDLAINIAGFNIMEESTIKDKIKKSGYSKYIAKLVKEYELEKNINWIGSLNESEMAKEMTKSHIFACPSSIENSPNSLGEAQITGTPCVAAYVGGIPDMVTNEYDGLLYRFEEYEMLAHNISRVFDNDELAQKLSNNGRISSGKRHNRENNLNQLINIYEEIINK